MAVELCKVSLWMEALDPGKPLSFLDAHIKCGNSLVGVGPGMEIDEIPDEAFKPAFGDDRATATAMRRRNKREREGQLGFRWDVTMIKDHQDLVQWISRQSHKLEDMPEKQVEQVRAKERAHQSLITDSQYLIGRFEYDLWTAAFFWPIPETDAETMLAPTQQELLRLRKGEDLDAELVHLVREIAEKQRFFHWAFEFPNVFAGEVPGFDVVLGNPPWERIKLQEQEFFAGQDPEIAKAPNKAARNKLIKKLPDQNPSLWRLFVKAKAEAENTSYFVRNSSRFPLTAVGDVNTYALFAGHVRQIISPIGRAGIIVPTGIATDNTTKAYFGDIIQTESLVSIVGFENEAFIFPSVHHAFKFCLLTIAGSVTKIEHAKFVFFCRYLHQIKEDIRWFELSAKDLAAINPNTQTTPVFRTRPDAELSRKIYQQVPVFYNERTGISPWNISFLRMLDMSNDSHIFINEPRDKYVPLYEAKMFFLNDHRYSTYKDATQANLNAGILPQPSDKQKDNPNFFVQPRYWVSKGDVEQRLSDWKFNWVLGFRDITSAVVERTSIFSLLPKVGIGNSAPLLLFHDTKVNLITCLIANLSSLVFDFFTRHKVGGTHLNFFIAKQLPVLPPESYKPCDWEFITPRVLELTFTAWDLQPFAQDMDYEGPPFRWDEERRALLRAELDAYYARLYGLNRKQLRYILDPADLTTAELEFILDPWEEVADPLDTEGYAARVTASTFPGETFRVLKKKEIKKYGEYRTRLMVLAAGDRLAAVDFDVEAYEPMADPPPAHPSVAHPNRDGSLYEGPGFVPMVEPIKTPKSSEARSTVKEPPPRFEESTTVELKVEESASEELSTKSSDYSLYKCKGCDQMVIGFDQESHVRTVHGGESPGFGRL